MFVNHRTAATGSSSSSAAAANENAMTRIHPYNNNSTKQGANSKIPSLTTTKTPNPAKRRAFGDISNRKQPQNQTSTTVKKTPSALPTFTRKNPQSAAILVPSTTTTKRSSQKVTFALANNNNNKTTTKKLIEDVEVSAGRVWSDQAKYHDDQVMDPSVEDILAEQEAWEVEVGEFCEQERNRHYKIRQYQNVLAEQELQERMKALWKQDDQGMSCVVYVFVTIVSTF